MKCLGGVLKPHVLLRLGMWVILFVWPLVIDNNYAMSNMVVAGLFAIIAIATNLIMGQTGQLSFGHAAFAAIGAYGTALTTVKLNWPPLAGLALGIVAAGVVAFVVGRPVLRLKLYFLALATMALVTIFTVVVRQASSITGGVTGVPGIPYLRIGGFEFGTYMRQYYFVWVAVLLVLLFTEAAMRSRVGRALRALAVNEVAASTLGIDVAAWKLRAFVVHAVFCGFAGGIWAMFLTSCTPSDFTLFTSITVVIMVMVGGMQSVLGSVIGAVLMTWLSFSLAAYQEYSQGIYAMVLIVLVLFLPGGIAGALSNARVRKGVLGLLPPVRKRGVARAAAHGASESPVAAASAAAAPSRGLPAVARSFIAGAKGEDGDGLRLEDVTVRFGGLTAVSQVSLTKPPNSITAVIGPNGAGKTTLFNVISGLQAPTTGKVWFRGKDLTTLGPSDIARLGMARTFQNLRIFGNMTVLDNVMAGRHRHERSHFLRAGLRLPSTRREERASREACMQVLELLGIVDRAEEMAGSLPYGQQRLVEIARALATQPSLLLLDEPAAGMNASEREVLAEKILTINAAGIDVLLVEHDMELVMGLSQDVAVLDHGRLICIGTPAEVTCHPEVVAAYLGVDHGAERAPRIGHIERVAGLPDIVPGTRILDVRGVSTYYGSIGALRDVSLQVDAGEVVAVLGANGAGKTTLLRTISGALRARSGSVLLDDRDITRLPVAGIVELGICQVPEGRHVFPTLSVEDNLLLGAGKQYKGPRYKAELASVYELFPILAERRRQAAGSLSGGEQQMLAIGRALMGRPRLLLLDEPSMGLAPIVVTAIFEALTVLNDGGLSLLMVEQNAEAALSIADRAVVLVTGEVALSGKASDLRHDPNLHDLYLGRRDAGTLSSSDVDDGRRG